MNFDKLVRRGVRRLFLLTLAPFLLAPFALPSVLLWMLGVRFLNIRHLHSIGHLSLEPDCYIKEELLGAHPSHKALFLAPRNKVINRKLIEYWQQYNQYIKVISSPIYCILLYPLTLFKWLQYDVSPYCMNDHETATCYTIYGKWGGRPSLLTLNKADHDRGWDCLKALGVPEGAWFVCVHARQSNDKQNTAHSSRDVDIFTYLAAIEEITNRGGWCIRLGDNAMRPLPRMKNVVDYALLDIKSEWMDVFLCASCRFFLGSSSGLSNLAGVFGAPCVLANLVPLSVRPVKNSDLGIPKLLWSEGEKRFLRFKEILDSPVGQANFFAPSFQEAGLTIVDNSPDEIKDLTIEMLDIIENKAVYSKNDEEMQNRFKSFFRSGHYGYGAESRVGRDFLRKHAELLL
ncbi:MAG: TIGR04372 family glycosyltransferase [Pseudomonadota bacterium]